MSAYHTPGNWHVVSPGPTHRLAIHADSKPICSICKGEGDEADARLIAAAPKLLEALTEAYSFISAPQQMSTPAGGPKTATYRVENYNALTAKIRTAIAKAEGRS